MSASHVEASLSPSAMAWVDRLIRHDTTSIGSNLELIDEVRDHFDRIGLAQALTFNADRTKANLFATIPGGLSETEGGIVLSGHTDVVPVIGQDWASDPFGPEIRGGRLFGRGSCDMKGFLGVAVSMAEEFAAMKLPTPVHFALSFDEELGCLGAPLMIEEFGSRNVRPRVCLIGEPTSMTPVVAHKAGRVYSCAVHGKACHSSLPQDGVNAIEYAARIIAHIRDLADSYRNGEARDFGFDPPFTTISVGSIRGGSAHNTVPADCEFRFEFRSLPSRSADEIEREIQAYIDECVLPQMNLEHEEARIELTRLANIPPFVERDSETLNRLLDALNASGKLRVSYGTEAGQFQAAGIETVICGPGSILQAHKANEFVDVSQLAQCEGVLRSIVSDGGRSKP